MAASQSASTVIAAGIEQDLDRRIEACIKLWDPRSPAAPSLTYTDVHNDDVTELHFHLSHTGVLLSGSTDGLLNVINTRNVAAIHKSCFLGEEGDLVIGVSSDEQASLYRRVDGQREDEDQATEEDKEDEDQKDVWKFGDVRELLQCEYMVDILPHRGGAIMAVGNTSRQHVDLIPLRPTPVWEFRQNETLRLQGAHGSEIVRCVAIDSENTVFTGGEDGIVKVWRVDDGFSGETDVQMKD